MKRYVLHPGEMRSKCDGQLHYISFAALVALYGLVPQMCIDASCATGFCREIDLEVNLYPRYDGKYRNEDGTPNPNPERR